jgi:urease accessory protein
LSEHSYGGDKALSLAASAERERFLLARVAGGDHEAFAELFDRLAPVVRHYLYRILGNNHGLTEEILQEIFLRVWLQAGRYRPELGTPCVWLLVMARSRALDALRQEATRSRREAAFHGEPSPFKPVGTSRLEQLELRSRVREALVRLSPEQRACLALAYEDDLSHREIARRLTMPLGSVKSRVRLGIKKLGTLIDADKVPFLAIFTFLAFASVALARPLAGGLLAGVRHPLTGLDHLIAMIAVGLWAGQMGGKARWRVPCAFVALMLVGGALGLAGIPLPFVESGVVASVFVLGLLVAAAVRWRPLASVALVGVFAVFHGHAHAAEVAAGVSGLEFAAGFAATTAALHGVGLLLAAALGRLDRPALLRWAGALVACSAFLL